MPDTSITLAPSAIQVDEMEKAVDVAEKNMNRFGLTTQEIRSRRSWVHDTRRTVSQDKAFGDFGLEDLEMCHVVSCMTSTPAAKAWQRLCNLLLLLLHLRCKVYQKHSWVSSTECNLALFG